MSNSSDEGLTDQQQRIKDRYKNIHGHWDPVHDDLLELDPDYLEKYLEVSAAAFEGGELDRKTTHLVALAADSATTHLYSDGIRHHVSAALDHGASAEEVLEVLQLVSVLGIHSVTYGGPLLTEELGTPEEPDATPEQRAELEKKWREQRGYWKENWGNMAEIDHEFIDRYLTFSSHPWTEGVLPPKIREFIYIAIDISTTHLYEPGTITHMHNASDHGATRAEIMEIFEIVGMIGFHTMRESVPILRDELEKRAGKD